MTCIKLGGVFLAAAHVFLVRKHSFLCFVPCIMLGGACPDAAGAPFLGFENNNGPWIFVTCIRLGEVFLAAASSFLEHNNVPRIL